MPPQGSASRTQSRDKKVGSGLEEQMDARSEEQAWRCTHSARDCSSAAPRRVAVVNLLHLSEPQREVGLRTEESLVER